MITRAQINGPLGWSLAAIVIVAIVVLVQVPPLLVALVTPGAPEDDAVTSKIKAVVKSSESLHAAYKDRFNGRSMFFPPKPPVTTPTTVVQAPTVTVTTPPPVETSYSGPLQVLFPFGDVVWFKDASGELVKLAPGQERDGVTLVAIDPPWTVRVKWRDKEWDLEQFKDFKKASDLINASDRLIAQPAAQVPGFTVVPQERTDSAATTEPAKEEPKPPQQSESSPQPTSETVPSASAASVEPSSELRESSVGEGETAPPEERDLSGDLPRLNHIPDPYSADQIESLTREESRQRLSELAKAIQIESITPEEKKRLLDEWKQVRDHMRDLLKERT